MDPKQSAPSLKDSKIGPHVIADPSYKDPKEDPQFLEAPGLCELRGRLGVARRAGRPAAAATRSPGAHGQASLGQPTVGASMIRHLLYLQYQIPQAHLRVDVRQVWGGFGVDRR